MPRGFTDKEFSFYEKRLLEVGEKLFSTYGLKKVSIDQIVKEVGIAKGSFYKFYKNKEDLCYDCMMVIEKRVRGEITGELETFTGTTGDLIAYILRAIPKVMTDYPLLTMLQDKDQLEALMLKVDPKRHQDNFDGDMDFFNTLFSGSGIKDQKEIEGLLALIWGMVYLSTNNEFLNGQYDNLILLLEKLVKNYYKGPKGDKK